MNIPLNKIIVAWLSCTSLFGCGGDSADSATDQKVTGKLIDGYITGAKIFMDLNFNSQHDAGEPSTTTGANGSFEFTKETISAQPCWKHVPYVAVVPVGAIDSDTPNTPVTEPYKMTFPPLSFKNSTSEVYVTPITTEVWNGANSNLHLDGLEMGCSELVSDESKVEELKQLVAKEEDKVMEKYAVSSLNLYSDYVASGNNALHTKAKETVSKLKVAFENETTLKAGNPDATYVRVSYFEDDGDTIRYQHITTEDGYIRKYDHVNSDDLTNVITTETHEIMRYIYNHDKTIKLESSYLLDDRTTDSNTYTCVYLENYKQVGSGVIYNIENHASSAAIADMDECKTVTLASNPSRQVLGVRIRNGNILTNKTRLMYPNGGFHPQYSGHFTLGNNPDNISHTILNSLSFIDVDFYSEEGHGASAWARARYDYTQATNYLVKDVHDENGQWARGIEYFDGRIDRICGDTEASLDTNPPVSNDNDTCNP